MEAWLPRKECWMGGGMNLYKSLAESCCGRIHSFIPEFDYAPSIYFDGIAPSYLIRNLAICKWDTRNSGTATRDTRLGTSEGQLGRHATSTSATGRFAVLGCATWGSNGGNMENELCGSWSLFWLFLWKYV